MRVDRIIGVHLPDIGDIYTEPCGSAFQQVIIPTS